MMVETTVGVLVNEEMVSNYFKNLVNQFFKILPMREKGEESLPTYIESLQCELLGCGDVIAQLNNDPSFLSLVSILEHLNSHVQELTIKQVKREVFKAISICNRFAAHYTNGGEATE